MRTKGPTAILLLFFLTACAAGFTASTPTDISISTSVAAPATAVISISTEVSLTITPAPSIPTTTSGSHLIYRKSVNGQEMLVIVDADAQEQRTQPLPAGASVERLDASISPNGKWLAFHSGSAEIQSGAGYDLALNLMDLSNGQTQVVTPLLLANFPDNFREESDYLTQQGIILMEGVDSAIFLRDAFSYGIHSLAWSPDGKYLAFAGQMDGFSSDLYTYEIETRMIRRLSDGIEQIQSITWSPDGKWILHGSANIVGEGAETHYHVAAVDGSAVKTLFTGLASFQVWLAPDQYLQWNIFDNGLQSVDIETGSIQTLWQGALISLAFDPPNDTVAVIGSEATGGGKPLTLFFVDITSGEVRTIRESVTWIEFLGFREKRFIANADGKTYFVSSNGSFTEKRFEENSKLISVSPDLRAVAVLGDFLQIYPLGDIFVYDMDLAWPTSSEAHILWRPDIPRAFVSLDSELYAADFVYEGFVLVDGDAPGYWNLDYTFSTPVDFSAEAVWDTPHGTEFSDCAFSSAARTRCAVSVMQVAGASQQATEFTQLVFGQGFLESFIESGEVDVARMLIVPRPSDILQYVMVNGMPRVVYAADDLGQIDITTDPIYPALLKKYPSLSIWESLNNFEGTGTLPGGGQRFIFSYDLVDGCHVCRTGSIAFVAFDFDSAGQFSGTTFLYLKE